MLAVEMGTMKAARSQKFYDTETLACKVERVVRLFQSDKKCSNASEREMKFANAESSKGCKIRL